MIDVGCLLRVDVSIEDCTEVLRLDRLSPERFLGDSFGIFALGLTGEPRGELQKESSTSGLLKCFENPNKSGHPPIKVQPPQPPPANK